MSDLVHARVVEHLRRLTLGNVAERIDAVLNEAARTQPTYLDFLDRLLCDEMSAKQRRRIEMGIKIAHFPTVKTLEEFDFKFQPSPCSTFARSLMIYTRSRDDRLRRVLSSSRQASARGNRQQE